MPDAEENSQHTLGSGPGPFASNGVFGGDDSRDDLSLFLATVPFAGNDLGAAVSGAWNVLAGPQGNRITVRQALVCCVVATIL